MQTPKSPTLRPAQVCFVVDDVAAAVDECAARFGWGPFHQFSAPVAEARYHDWSGPKRTDVALGMAGLVQVELIHVHEGHDTVEAYQSRYGAGFQHLGIHCRDREAALHALEAIGACRDDVGEYPGIRFAFVDTPTGPGMFELLQATGDTPPPGDDANAPAPQKTPAVTLDRATIATDDVETALAFYAQAFGWSDVGIVTRTLRYDGREARLRRAGGKAGLLRLELVEPTPGSDDPYARHLERGDHGLAHAGGVADREIPAEGTVVECEWLEEGDPFALVSWAGGVGSLQLRRSS